MNDEASTMNTRPGMSFKNPSTDETIVGMPFMSGDAQLVYYDTGPRTRTPLVVVAGGPGFDQTYLHIGDAFAQLAETHRVVCYDQRGTGNSSRFTAEDDFTVADYVADIEALRRTLEVESMDVMGQSFGGYLAMAYAVEHTVRVRRLVLVDSVAPKRSATAFVFHEAFPERMDAWRTWRAAIVERNASAAKQLTDVYLSMLFYDPAKGDAWRKAAVHVDFNPIPNGALWREKAGPDLTDSVRKLTMPTLVMTGRFDMNISVRTAWDIKNALPNARFLVFERSGHMPFYEEPEAFVSAVRAFLDER